MGGIHLTTRGTYYRKYLGVQSDLTLPTAVSSDSRVGIKPEYMFGMYADKYGLDIGVVYQNNEFCLFYWSLSDEESGSWHTCIQRGSTADPSIRANPGEKITLKAYLNGNKITCEAIRSNGSKTTLDALLTSEAVEQFQKGAYINRELVIAANPKYIVNPCNVYTYNGIFSNGFVTRIGTYEREQLNNSNSTITKLELPEEDRDGRVNIDKSKIKVLSTECGYDAYGYSYEKATCDLNQK
ncbi:hypothetical protein Curi_c27810 [Gottschalkia acidurici 9a]|uniref:Uncharacterized protein n=1 Tax=Gottschalkia acidurici (strain ATCC 7906 / DSM 604 / BCRC 14475 / CIP 104303 / KCTC 5404 / NCIMB 10678 / 9a) TaxID=1128398 RepID=K0B2Q1_GOTA9|nr:hypothetical protein [Gottschalkia acidurici]AFS79774.1 hypothetical protein Curi_c27810 [Gottschalkia acidurici 9a]